MSQLQCLESVKKRRRVASWKSVESCATDPLPRIGRKQSESSTKLYEIEVLEEKGSQVKVHYTGYGSMMNGRRRVTYFQNQHFILMLNSPSLR